MEFKAQAAPLFILHPHQVVVQCAQVFMQLFQFEGSFSNFGFELRLGSDCSGNVYTLAQNALDCSCNITHWEVREIKIEYLLTSLATDIHLTSRNGTDLTALIYPIQKLRQALLHKFREDLSDRLPKKLVTIASNDLKIPIVRKTKNVIRTNK